MKNVRRYNVPGASTFVTVVTHNRSPILLVEPDIFFQSWKNIFPEAWVVLPDHFHALIPCSGEELSHVMHGFKITFSRHYRDKYRRGRVWQNRFWDHIIRNSDDLGRHLDYIHFNPVKHGLSSSPHEYRHSSFERFVKSGHYNPSWGSSPIEFATDAFGE